MPAAWSSARRSARPPGLVLRELRRAASKGAERDLGVDSTIPWSASARASTSKMRPTQGEGLPRELLAGELAGYLAGLGETLRE
jgi:hypothetical protein